MSFNIHSLRKNLFVSFIISYLIILLIPVFIGGLIYFSSVNIVKNQILQANNLFLSQLKQTFDITLEDIDKISLELGVSNKDIINLAMKESIADTDRLVIHRICDQLKQYKISKPFIEEIYIYLKKTGLILDADNCTSDTMYYKIYIRDKVDFDDWYAFLQNDYRRSLNILPISSESSDEENITLYTQSLPIQSLSFSSANLVIVIDKKEMIRNLKEFEEFNKGRVFVLDESGTILLSTGKSEGLIDISYDMLDENRNPILLDDLIISYTSSDILPIKYVSAVPNEAFWESASYFKRMTAVGNVIILIVGGLLVFYMARKNYNPIKDIISRIMQAGGFKEKDEYDDYKFIQNAISTTIKEKENALNMLNKKDLLLRDTYVKNLLRKRIEFKEDVKNMLLKYGINFDKEYLMVAYASIVRLNVDSDMSDELLFLKNIISTELEQRVDIAGNYVLLDGDNCDLILILNVAYKLDKDYKNMLSDMFSNIIYRSRSETDLQMIITVSNIHESPSGFPVCSAEAADAMEHAVLNRKSGVIFYEDIKKSTFGYNYSLETRQKILTLVREGKSEEAKVVIEELIDSNYEDMLLPGEMMKSLIFDITLSVLRILDKSEDLYYLEELRAINRLMECNSINSMKSEFFDILDDVCNYVSIRNQKNERSQLISKVQDYVFCYYSNKDINVNSIGLHFNLTPHYLAKIYKEETGEPLLTLIDKTRIEKAKQLLALNDRYTLGEVADMVGFTNSHALIRVFKKYEGITPGKYRATHN